MDNTVLKSTIVNKVVTVSSIFDDNYQAILNRAIFLGIPLPSELDQIKQNRLMLNLISSGIFSKLDFMLVFKNAGSFEFGAIDWITPSRTPANKFGNITYDNVLGVKSDGLSGWINTSYFVPPGARTFNGSSFSYHPETITELDSGLPFSPVYGCQGNNFEGFWLRLGGANTAAILQRTLFPLYSGQRYDAAGLSLIQKINGSGVRLIQDGDYKSFLTIGGDSYNGPVPIALFARPDYGGDLFNINSYLSVIGYGQNLVGYEATFKTILDNHNLA